MSFLSLRYYIFLLIVFVLYHMLNRRKQNVLLLISSYVFYAAWDWRFSGLLIASTLIDYYCGLKIYSEKTDSGKKQYLFVSIAANLFLLGIFKYANFFIEEFSGLLSHFGIVGSSPSLHIILPLGLSFYTFQTMSYTIDVYRGIVKPTRDIVDYSLYVSLFFQLAAGPIERAHRFLQQVQEPRTISFTGVTDGLHLIFWGLFKKVYIATYCLQLVDTIVPRYAQSSGGELLVALYAFAIQFYCDISGYTDIARGSAKLFGFDLSLNFRLPYFSKNISEFWHRWHMSMTGWFRDYVYFPVLVKSKGNAALSSAITLLCISVWHSLSLNSVLRGVYFGFLIIAYHGLKRSYLKRIPENAEFVTRILKLGGVVLTFNLVCFGWLWFQNIPPFAVLEIIKKIICGFDIADFYERFTCLLWYSWFLVAVQILQAITNDEMVLARQHISIKIVIYWGMFWAIFGSSSGVPLPFVYFEF